ncbi:peptidoglycan-binding domain-containing protein [Frateuria soli]|uniref:peptidoglycan-binding domain-containing protein n=1 Tax=Frateuria soli TaxID=1542730 RepID=UPI001E5DDDDE|nr:peptidoglycan-binding domain-containing protein [Frateuria soli]UGB37187.1 peptidoglycan-binding protein [Frateuria soli]
MRGPDTHDIDAVAGAMYFVVGRATEGGPDPYRLSIAGITRQGGDRDWGKVEEVIANSGYSLGTIQVDLGQRGTWPLGATEDVPPKPGQATYVDALVAQVAKYAEAHHLEFPSDRAQLRGDLLTHGNGKGRHSALKFIDSATRDSFNAWAGSEEGERWIHAKIDYPQVRNAARQALDMLDSVGKNIPEDRRFETLALLTKTANQRPSGMAEFRKVLSGGGDYEDVVAKAQEMAIHHRGYAGVAAVQAAGRYLRAYDDPEKAAALARAQAEVGREDFNPATFASDQDLQEGLRAIGQGRPIHVLRQGSHGEEVVSLQARLARLGVTDTQGHALKPDGDFGPSTRQAVAAFQHTHGLEADGRAGPKTLEALDDAIRRQPASLADRAHAGHPLFCQALEKVHLIDARCGRTPDPLSSNLAGSLATAAQARGLARIDHVVLGENATRAFAVQGELDSPFRRFASVDILQAVATPLEKSSAAFPAVPRPRAEESPVTLPRQTFDQPAMQDAHRQ